MEEKIYQAAISCGFDNCGIISLDALSEFDALYQERKRTSAGGRVFYNMLEGEFKTKKRFPWAKALVICIHNYDRYAYPESLQGKYAKDFFLVPENGSAGSYDYEMFEHRLSELGIRYAGGESYKYYSVAPLRYAAMKAGLGIIRKNNFLYTEHGSHNRLMGYVIDQECELIQTCNLRACSDNCNLCQKACQTRALSAPYTFNPMRCVSLWTTFGKGFVPPFLKRVQFGNWICGCDACQDACPYNKKVNWNEGIAFSNLQEIAEDLQPEKLLSHSNEYLIKEVISKTDQHLKPSDVHVLKRNAKRVLGSHRRQK